MPKFNKVTKVNYAELAHLGEKKIAERDAQVVDDWREQNEQSEQDAEPLNAGRDMAGRREADRMRQQQRMQERYGKADTGAGAEDEKPDEKLENEDDRNSDFLRRTRARAAVKQAKLPKVADKEPLTWSQRLKNFFVGGKEWTAGKIFKIFRTILGVISTISSMIGCLFSFIYIVATVATGLIIYSLVDALLKRLGI